ncbi:MAG: hypothetical protein HKN04_13225 [Rhodothermaceae bacterium]|nr:hypothetical protein [Rhodothermaceae bacterium]
MTRSLSLLSFALLLVSASAQAQVYVTTPLSLDREAARGSTYEGLVSIANSTDTEQEVRLYLTDYRFNAEGANWYDEPGTSERSNAGWIAFGASQVTIPPEGALDVPFLVTVPEDDTLDGTFWSMLMVEGIPRESAESILGGDSDHQFAVERRIRYGVQVATHIVQTGVTDLAIPSAQLAGAPDGARELQVDVENIGTRLGDTRVYLDLFDAAGESVGRFEGSAARIYPGTSFRHRVPLEGVAPGVYEALLVIETEGDEAFGAQYTLEL